MKQVSQSNNKTDLISLPITDAKTLPVNYYYDQDIYKTEIETIWNNSWQLVTRESELSSPGDFITSRVGELDIIVLRDKDNSIKSFVNVCRHRGATLIREASGKNLKVIVCPFHSWCYNLDGSLRKARSINYIDNSNYGLVELAVKVRRGLVYVNPNKDALFSIDKIDAFSQRLGPYPIETLLNKHRMQAKVNANWKIVLATFNECYHCDSVHHEFSRVMTDGETDILSPPIFGGWQCIRPDFNTLTVEGVSRRSLFENLPNHDLGRVYGYCLYPSNFYVLAPDYVLLTQFIPNGPEQTIVIDELLCDGETSVDDIVKFWEISNRQDWEMCELVQRGINHGYKPGPFSLEEDITYDMEKWYAMLMNEKM